ncbi:uncharacterized protein SPAPADRAFT_58402 [Spathaspora passalidarum NRRL Y-27907]|uniref:UBX domain-containing protein n=1 Tax=Spathaspora passalidarum (strain NRRL Y-27907 / 11-Y1) TaxID=619300 RepID=G3AG61_SPAPN|nr:uncharacterized protein SPAPADRAFT_58402 [Spathaspora passalidarum NRRL Y-27907]EGW35200.1 hypothetical protein SPAPADRAFT_58402 [Spathaspora passalidarum NRRL Y-27907]
MDEQIPTFLAVTGVEDEAIAKQFLEATGGDLEYAVQLYMEQGQHNTTATSSNAIPNETTPGSDEELAKRLQEEAYAQGEQVREADANIHRHETLVDSLGGGFHPGMANFTRPSDIFGQRQQGIFHQQFNFDNRFEELEDDEEEDHDYYDAHDDEDDIEILDDDSDEEARPVSRRRRLRESRDQELTSTQRRLAALFRPPFDIITVANLDMAKQQGKETSKWILINIQDSSEFQSQVMNRDFWSNEHVKQVVKEFFIFLQYQRDSPNGETYVNFYHADAFPHLAILDPLTGERVYKWQDGEVPKVDEWLSQVDDFLNKFSLLPDSRNPLVTHDVKIDPDSLTEEQQIELAMKQSMLESAGNTENDAIILDSDEEAFAEAPETPPPATPQDPFEAIQPINHAEPDAQPFTRVQIRFPNGKRLVRKLNPSDTIQSLFEWLKYVLQQQGEEFGISSEDKFNLSNSSNKSFKFIESLHQTIEEANLKNASILLEKD